jgi:hypothetical protein
MRSTLLVAWGCVGIACGATHRWPQSHGAPSAEVAALTVAFPAPEQGDLFFEVELPPDIPRVASVRWELWLFDVRFAEGVVMTPDIVNGADGKRRARVEAPLVYRHRGFRDGAVWLDVGVRGELLPWGASAAGRSFRKRVTLLVNGSPFLDGKPAGRGARTWEGLPRESEVARR